MYKLINDINGQLIPNIIKRVSDNAFIPFVADNTDYAKFKAAINAESAELQDADGNTMTAVEAKEFVATLP